MAGIGQLAEIIKTLATLGLITATTLACGSPPGLDDGGSNESPSVNSTGEIEITVEKYEMNSGDFNRIHIDLFDINEKGVILKLRYPSSIKYSKGSGTLFPGERDEYPLTPYTEATSGKDRYLVFFISQDMALNRGHLPLDLDLKAITSDEEAFVEFDLDNNDERIADTLEFRVSNPKFTAIEHHDIKILAEDSAASATPTPAP